LRPGARSLALAALLGASAGLAAGQAQTTVFGGAGVMQPWLGLGNDVRSAALGGAVGAITGGDAALQDNPAGLDAMVDPELTLAHNEWDTDLGLREEYLAYGARYADGALAGSFRYLSLGNFDNRDANGAPLDASNDNAFAGALGFGETVWNDAFHLGGALTASQETLSGQASNLYTGSLGAIYDLPWGFRAAAAGLDLKISSDSAEAGPGSTRVGLGWMNRDHSVQLDADWTRPQLGDSTLRLGGEWTLDGSYSLRAGYRFAQGEGSSPDAGPSFGAGLRLGQDLRVDYAYVPYGVLTNTQQVGVTLYLGAGFFGGGAIVIDAAGDSAQAQADYLEALKAFQGQDWAEAKVDMEHALKHADGFPWVQDAKLKLAEAAKHISDAKAQGNNGDFKAFSAKKLREAQALFKGGDLLGTLKVLEEIFSYVPNLKDAVELKRMVEASVAQKVASLKNDAVNALQSGDLVTGVKKYRAVLKLEEDDGEARSNLIKLAPRVNQEITRLHHEGIDAYVVDDYNKAIQLWQAALDLDPSDPQNVGHDLGRAKKLKELTGK